MEKELMTNITFRIPETLLREMEKVADKSVSNRASFYRICLIHGFEYFTRDVDLQTPFVVVPLTVDERRDFSRLCRSEKSNFYRFCKRIFNLGLTVYKEVKNEK